MYLTTIIKYGIREIKKERQNRYIIQNQFFFLFGIKIRYVIFLLKLIMMICFCYIIMAATY